MHVLTRATFNQTRITQMLLNRRRWILLLRAIPHRAFHRSLVAVCWLESWIRVPVGTTRLSRSYDRSFNELDPGGTRYGLTSAVRNRFKRRQLFEMDADIATLLLFLEKQSFVNRALRTTGEEVLASERAAGRGVIVVGFRIGAYPALPWLLARQGIPVTMILRGWYRDLVEELTSAYLPSLPPIRWLSADDRSVTSRSIGTLRGGGLLCTLIDVIGTTGVRSSARLFGHEVLLPRGLPFLAALTGSSIVPAIVTRDGGPQFTLRFGAPLPLPERGIEGAEKALQEICDQLESWVREFPDQWIGWPTLSSLPTVPPTPILSSHGCDQNGRTR